MRRQLTDRDMLDAARKKLAAHARLRRGSRPEDMDQDWIDTRDELAGRVVYYAALVGGEDRDAAHAYSDQPYHASNPYRLTIAQANGDEPLLLPTATAQPPGRGRPRKSPAQLDREIAEALRRRR